MSEEEAARLLTKKDRLAAAERDARLERSRFVLSNVPELRARMKELREVVRTLQKEYPELISLSLYGSHTKGYAHQGSDIDGVIFIDHEIARKRGNERLELRRIVQKAVQQELGLKASQVSIDAVSISLHSPDSLKNPRLFHLALGDGIETYRDKALRMFEEKGEEGEQEWQRLVFELALHENHSFSDEFVEKRVHLYPWSLEKARRFYVRGTGDYEEKS